MYRAKPGSPGPRFDSRAAEICRPFARPIGPHQLVGAALVLDLACCILNSNKNVFGPKQSAFL